MLAGIAGVGGLGIGVFLVCWFVLSWFYGGLFETFWNGQTPGKRLFGLRVLTVDGTPINAMQAVLRNVLRDVDAMPIVGAGGAVGHSAVHARTGHDGGQRPLSAAGRSGLRHDRGRRTARASCVGWRRSGKPKRSRFAQIAAGQFRGQPGDGASALDLCGAARAVLAGPALRDRPHADRALVRALGTCRPTRIPTCCCARCTIARSLPTGPPASPTALTGRPLAEAGSR